MWEYWQRGACPASFTVELEQDYCRRTEAS
jgi:hypothetical protein